MAIPVQNGLVRERTALLQEMTALLGMTAGENRTVEMTSEAAVFVKCELSLAEKVVVKLESMRIEDLMSSWGIGISAAGRVFDKVAQKEVRKIVNEDDVRGMDGSTGTDQSEGFARTRGEKDVLALSPVCCPETASHVVATVANLLAVQAVPAHNSIAAGTDTVAAAQEAQGPDASIPEGSDWQTGSPMIVRQVRSLPGSRFPRPSTMCRKVELKTLNTDLGVEDVKLVVHVGTKGGVE
jgi:hypothetical protein